MTVGLSGKVVCVHFLTEGVVDPISLLLDLLIQPLHILHQQGHDLTLQLQTQTGEVQFRVLKHLYAPKRQIDIHQGGHTQKEVY